MKSKMLGALALFTLIGALFVMQSADQYTPTADAAAGSIDALNVGTCLTTDAKVFKGDCEDAAEDPRLSGGSGSDKWEIREKITEVTTLYATYAHDPKTASEEPRAIIEDSDLLKISISDPDRDKRTGVLIGGEGTLLNDGATPPVLTALGAKIEGDLGKLDYPVATNGLIAYTHSELDYNTNHSTQPSVIANSGNHTLNFTRDSGSTEKFLPGDFDVENEAEVRFYGCLEETAGNDDDQDCVDTGETIDNLKDELRVDEDRSNGEATDNIAPWLGVNASVPDGKQIVILAIYYQTSEKENLVGGEKYSYGCPVGYTLKATRDADKERTSNPLKTPWKCEKVTVGVDGKRVTQDQDSKIRDLTTNVVYTESEIDGNKPMLVQVKSNVAGAKQNLYLQETGRFTGMYQGYVRLTDANGDGSVDDNPDTTAVETKPRDDWGHKTQDAASSAKADAAVLAAGTGAVTVSYRDSDGKEQKLRIEIDRTPPSITVDSPAHESSSGDQSPDFSGVIEDADSGLVDKSFRLVIDNRVDGEGKNNDYVLDMPLATNISGPDAGVTYNLQYSGYTDALPTFGEVTATEMYDLGDDSCDDEDRCFIEAEAYDDGANRGTFDDSIRLDLQDGGPTDVDTRDKEFEIDFQAFVMDMAGNIGFSDSDPAKPRFIKDLGEKDATKRIKLIDLAILGYYSAHVITLDEKDPVIDDDQTATGFYGLDADKKVIPDRYGVMIVFDGPIAESSVSNDTFTVELDDKSMASVVDVDVKKNYVFLKLASELASDATPMIDIANGERVEDMAGNETFGKEVKAFEVNDGISPKLTVTFSGGSGSGTGDEGPEELTKDKMTVHVSSDEPLQSAPKIIVACDTLRWNQKEDATGDVFENQVDSKHDIDDFVANRTGSFADEPSEPDTLVRTKPRSSNTKATDATDRYTYTCGYDADKDNFGDDFQLTTVPALARQGDTWERTWQNETALSRKLADNTLTAVAFGRDVSSYGVDEELTNWGAASAEFTLDTELLDPSDATKVTDGVQPADGGTSKETRPFVLIDFGEIESRTVTLDSVELDDVEIASKFENPQFNRFVYWPESMSKGKHKVEVEATDAAGNEVSFDFSFTLEARGDFMIELQAGWNAISVPADPVDTAIGSVFTDAAVETVIGWDTQGWRIAVRRDGVWESNDKIGEPLNEIRSKYGYWVKSSKFIDQPVALTSNDRGVGGPRTPISIDTVAGRWNFVGVIDQDGDQTEDNFGDSLKSGKTLISAAEYLGSKYVRAYTWDATFSNFEVVRPDDDMNIGDGVWVYYEGGIAP